MWYIIVGVIAIILLLYFRPEQSTGENENDKFCDIWKGWHDE